MNVENRIGLPEGPVVTTEALDHDVTGALDRINAGGRPVVVTKQGRMVAIITPIEHRGVEATALSHNSDVQRLVEIEAERARCGRITSRSLDDAEAWLRHA
jgi:antitoxin (DNA-binding transcriptional repressor) of toxin-antitoxin stability system